MAGVVLAELHPVVLDVGEFVYRQGDPHGLMYLIDEGRLRVLHEEGGRQMHVTNLAEGETFGVVSALRKTPHTTSVEALTPVRLLTLSGDTLERLGEALPAFRSMLDDRLAQYRISRHRRRPRGHRPGDPAGEHDGYGGGQRRPGRSVGGRGRRSPGERPVCRR